MGERECCGAAIHHKSEGPFGMTLVQCPCLAENEVKLVSTVDEVTVTVEEGSAT